MKIRIFFVLISLSISGCSLLYSYSDDLPQRIDQLVAEKKFNTALTTIDYIQPTHKDYRIIQQKKMTILKQMATYEYMAFDKSTRLASQGNWIKAFEILDEVTNNLTDATNLEKHRAQLLLKRNKIITGYEKDVLHVEAINLAKKMELYKKIKKIVVISEINQLNISEFDESRKETIARLTMRSEKQFTKNQYDDALTTIDLAIKLKPDAETLLQLKDIKDQIKEVTKQKNLSDIEKAKALLSKLSQGYSHAILIETKKTILWLNKYKENKNEHQKLITKLEKHLAAGIKQRFEAARKLYSEGKTQESLSIWLKLKILDPLNAKLQSHIERAEKVLLKFEELSNKPQPKNKK